MKKKMYIFLSFLLILVFFLTSCSNNQVTVKEKIDKANYVIVNIRPQFEQLYYLDLKSKLYYATLVIITYIMQITILIQTRS